MPGKFLCWYGQAFAQQEFPTGAWQQVPPPHCRVVQVAWQLPEAQVVPVPQATLQPPQFAGSVRVFTQTPLHSVRPVAHTGWQVPDAHSWPSAQTLPQAPQFFGSFWTFVQTVAVPVPHCCFGDAQTQVPGAPGAGGVQVSPG